MAAADRERDRDTGLVSTIKGMWITLPILSMIAGPLTFIVGWVYAIGEFGFFLGVGIGWIPAFFIAYFVAATIKIIVVGLLYVFHSVTGKQASIEKSVPDNGADRSVVDDYEGLTNEQKKEIDSRVAKAGPNLIAAYMWWLLGVVGLPGAQRLYLGELGAGIIMMFSPTGLLIGYTFLTNTEYAILDHVIILIIASFWLAAIYTAHAIDAFQIPNLVRAERSRRRQRLAVEAVAKNRRIAPFSTASGIRTVARRART